MIAAYVAGEMIIKAVASLDKIVEGGVYDPDYVAQQKDSLGLAAKLVQAEMNRQFKGYVERLASNEAA